MLQHVWKGSVLLLVGLFWSSSVAFAQGRIKYNFNADWKLKQADLADAQRSNYNDADWQTVTLPHAWNEDAAFKVAIDQLPTGIVWYRKHFKLPAQAKGKKVFIEFEGIRQAGTIYINGQYVGLHENGVMAFGLDITDRVDFNQENVIALRIDNDWDYREKATNTKFQWSDRNFNANYGGIPKNVWLHVTDKLYQTLPLYTFLQTSGTYIYAKDFDIPHKTATVVAQSEVKNEYTTAKTFGFEVEIIDLDGNTVKKFEGPTTTLRSGETKNVTAEALLQHLHFWSWGYGYLYTVVTRLKVDGKAVDEVYTKTGFRKTAFHDGMVYLNDRVLMMKGYAQRTSNEWPAIGLSVPPWLSDFSNGLMVNSNANLVRWMHITPWKQDVESCDRVGLLQAMPAGDAEHDVEGTRWEQRKQLMRDAMIYNRNNPSIVFYECGNESISEQHMREMKAIRDQYDPFGGRAIGSREMLDSKVAEYGGEMLYINKSADIPMWAMEYARDEGLRKYWDEYTPPYHPDGDGPLYRNASAKAYNRNQDSHAIEDVIRWDEYWRQRPGTGKRVSSGGVNIIFSDSNTHFRGAENYRRSGEVDPMRIEKDGYYAHQVMWDGWVDVEKPRVHIIGHWNYRPDVTKPIYVVAAGEKTELFVNGKSKGFGQRSYDFLFTFPDVTWEAGTIKAVTYDGAGKVLATDEIQTAGKPKSVKLTVAHAPKGFKADGADLALVTVEVVDAKGNRCPTALNQIDFVLDGPAEWRGGIAQGPDNYILSKSLPVEGGINRVLIRSTTQAGKITLKAQSTGLTAAKISLVSVPVKVENGLSLNRPDDGLKPNLQRGQTPVGSSVKLTRTALTIQSVQAGAHADQAAQSYDDNELSGWTNDGTLETAWITYRLDKPTVIKEVVLKLNNFRTRSYPLQVLVDGQEVFKGVTEKSLGYITLPCKNAKGQTVTIRLQQTKAADEQIFIGEEVSGKKLDDGLSESNTQTKKETWSIIEAEIYGNNGK